MSGTVTVTFDAKTPPAAFTVDYYPEAYNCAGRPEAFKTVFLCPPGTEYSFQPSWCAGKLRLSELGFSDTVASDANSETAGDVHLSRYNNEQDVRVRRCADGDAWWMNQIGGWKDWEKIRQTGVIAFA
ncbi:hypothetical protein MSAN_00579100 [Mycena sanguinolenta]|uniref:Uncharacterized protein n=1 Tax=Mycena sanguinolenta TaxID=230812 RepID=A0A8H6ZB67_9AGAR|nr:hypothetical protein MSAN_00579100 [Mycena sanguinolenta]